jgi:GNAT superfamily N-acetyltransferase
VVEQRTPNALARVRFLHRPPMESSNIYKKEMKLAESLFGTETDPDQIPVTEESLKKLLALGPDTMLHELNEKGEPVSWLVAVPTINLLADQFLKGEITEKELFDRTEPSSHYDALYLSSFITVPEERRKGLARKLFLRAVQIFREKYGVKRFLAWIYSEDGKRMYEKLKAEGYEVELRISES